MMPATAGEDAIPFAGLLDGWLAAACRRTPPDDGLRRRVSELVTPVLLALLDRRRTLPPLARLLAETPANAPREAYQALAAEVAGRGLTAVLEPWPVLRALLPVLVAQHDSTMTEFARHLAEDRELLQRRVRDWCDGVPPVTGMRFGLSDPHDGGRSVGRITFADGRMVAYKPRGLGAEDAFGQLLAALDLDQRTPWIIDRGDHGWMEWVSRRPCAGRREAAAFYRRCGALLGVLRGLRGGDIHPDNLIACGPYPVVIDLECLFQPAPADLGIADPLLDPLAFQAGILPVFTSFDGGETLGATAAAGTATVPWRPDRGIRHDATDWTHLALTQVPAFADQGPMLDGVLLDVRDFARPFAAGYRQGLEALRRQPQAVEAFRAVPVRFLAAPTNLYALLLEAARAPDCLVEPDTFHRTLARAAGRPPLLGDAAAWGAVLAAETEALARLDVPAFRFRPAQCEVEEAGGRRLPGIFARPMLDRIRHDLDALTPRAVGAESAMIAAALRRPQSRAEADAAPRSVLRRLADHIDALAVPVERGIAWVRLWEQMPAPVSPAGPGLCYGAGGIAVALAEAARLLGDERLARRSRRALGPWRRLEPADLAARIGPGWGRGLGGVLAALAWCGDLLERPDLLRDALRLAEGVPAALRLASGVPDVLEGAAGLALGLAELHRRRPRSDLAAAMAACGDLILDRSAVTGGGRAWPDGPRPGLAGLSHGAAGIAAALAHIAHATGDGMWRNAAAAALAYEDGLYDATRGNWRHLGGGGFKSTWCHGAPGIALARQAVADLLPELAAAQEPVLTAALATTAGTPLPDVDDLCCGEAGRIEILSSLAARRGDQAAAAAATAILDSRLGDWAAGRPRLLAARAGAPDDPSLLRGLGGLIHVLVRREAPDLAAPVLLPVTPAAAVAVARRPQKSRGGP
jgi:type 2 lantibiotic biosynthesis protein LanM